MSFGCPFCPTWTCQGSVGKLTQHFQVRHPNNVPRTLYWPTADFALTYRDCPLCSATFSSRQGLKAHVNRKHTTYRVHVDDDGRLTAAGRSMAAAEGLHLTDTPQAPLPPPPPVPSPGVTPNTPRAHPANNIPAAALPTAPTGGSDVPALFTPPQAPTTTAGSSPSRSRRAGRTRRVPQTPAEHAEPIAPPLDQAAPPIVGTTADVSLDRRTVDEHIALNHRAPEVLDRLKGIFRQGLYRTHHTWEAPLRELSTALIKLIDAYREDHNSNVVAFLLLPGLVQALKILKKPRPIDFLRAALAHDNKTGYILTMAELIAPVVVEFRTRVANKRGQRGNMTKSALKRRYRRLIESLYADGRLSAATTILEAATKLLQRPDFSPPTPPSKEWTIETLRNLNPVAGDDDVFPLEPEENDVTTEEPILTITPDIVSDVIRALPKGSANGASGWTCGLVHKLYASVEISMTEHHDTIASFFTRMASGQLPSDHWVVSRAVLIPKNDHAFRPLGIGETWYRVLGRALLSAVCAEVGAQLSPLQLGCGIQGGCEIAARAAQLFLDHDHLHVLIKTDFKNAFNLTPRKAIYDGLVEFCPQLLPWYRWAYGKPSPLVDSAGEVVGSSETGCRQGDPLAALLFCVAIQQALRSINQLIEELQDERALSESNLVDRGSIGHVIAYMDDCTISVPYYLAAEVCGRLEEICSSCGLILNRAKCRVIGPKVVDILDDPRLFTRCEQGDIVLGNPVGTTEFREQSNQESIESYVACLPTLHQLDISPLVSLNLIRFCVNARASYLARVQDVEGLTTLKRFDAAVDQAISDVTQHHIAVTQVDPDPDRSELTATLRSLPLSYGGLGVQRYSWIPGQVGTLRSRQLTANFVQDHFPLLSRKLDELEPINIGIVNCPCSSYTTGCIESTQADSALADRGEVSIAEIAEAQYAAVALRLINQFNQSPSGAARAAWLRSSQFVGSGGFLYPAMGIIQPDYMTMSKEEYRVSLRQRLLLAPFEDVPNTLHPAQCNCNTALDDLNDPFHFLDCAHNQAFWYNRHTNCVKVIESFLKKRLLGARLAKEPWFHLGEVASPTLRGDLAIVTNEFYQVIDVTVSNPAASTYLKDAVQAHLHTNATNTHRENEKLMKYRDTNECRIGQFIPVAIEATGRMGPRGHAWVEALFVAQTRSRRERGLKDLSVVLQAQLGLVIAKGNASMILFHRRNAWRRHMDGQLVAH